MKKTIRMAADRYEGERIVLIPDDGGDALILSRAEYTIAVGDVLDVTLEDGKVLDLSVCKDEKKRREDAARARLAALFAKGKKPK
ncbi:MAG: hypothetical protein IKA53_02040 [Clostridia bacterium]|nr:hypothetical protein [Clostridia bacterium]MBQ8269238.1 hypothetical protein [Clostridia bacterium]MBR2324802.1 hypothetical protein [Clostridia bacterium]